MRKVARGNKPAPSALRAQDKSGKTELERVRAHQNDTNPSKKSFEFGAYKHDEVKQRLNELFHGKCAYCETFFAASAPVDIEHYRPKGAVSEDNTHPGYWWLAMAWDNLLPCCIDCNRKRHQLAPLPSTSLFELYEHASRSGFQSSLSGKKDSFPIAAAGQRLQPESADFDSEKALLLDPTRDAPDEHLRFNVDLPASLGLILPCDIKGKLSERGAVSIQVYGLNRLGLVQDRTRLLRRLEFLGDLVIELAAIIQDIDNNEVTAALKKVGVQELPRRLRLLQDRTLNEMREMASPKAPYSSMVKAWLSKFAERFT